MKVFTPRHMRKKFARKGGAGGDTKKIAFRRCKRVSDRFINQSASALASPRLAKHYAVYCELTGKGTGFRKGG